MSTQFSSTEELVVWTKDLKQAKRRDHQEALRATQLFDQAVLALAAQAAPGSITDTDIEEIADEMFIELLGGHAAEREDEMTGGIFRLLRIVKDFPTLAECADVLTSNPGKQIILVLRGLTVLGY